MLSEREFMRQMLKQGIKVSPVDRLEEATLDPEVVEKWKAEGLKLVFHGIGLKPEWRERSDGRG